MQPDILNPRRAPRVPLRATAEIRHRVFRWEGETEDVGPTGCQLVSPRPLDPGREVKLALRVDPLGRTVNAAGKVVWARAGAPGRLGVAFERSGTERGWFEALLRQDPAAEGAARTAPDRLARTSRLGLGSPPPLVAVFSPTELELLRRVAPGVTLDALARSFGPELDERTRGALFGLIARGLVVLDAVVPAVAARWRAILPDDDDAREAAPVAPEAAPRLLRWA